MASGRRVRHLAKRAAVSPAKALDLLRDVGFPQTNPNQLIKAGDVARAEVRLGLPGPKRDTPRVSVTGTSLELKLRPESPDSTSSHLERSRSQRSPRQREVRLTYLDLAQLTEIHERLVTDFSSGEDPIDPPGSREGGAILEAVVHRPYTSFGETLKYLTVETATVALFHSLVHSHPFHNDNKRTAVVALLVMLNRNQHVVVADEDAVFRLVLSLAKHQLVDGDGDASDAEVEVIAGWITDNSRSIAKGERILKFRELESLLRSHGCSIERREGNKVVARRWKLTSHFGARNAGDEFDRAAVSYVRKDLELDEAHGFDSEIFYGGHKPVDNFINHYRKVLERLAPL